MQAEGVHINDVCRKGILLEVPFYQRAYVWGEELWKRLLDDMEQVTNDRKSYFMGALILKETLAPMKEKNYLSRKIVVDGQQRLTTILLFLKVYYLKHGKDYLFREEFFLDDETCCLKHSMNDQEAFSIVMQQTELQEIESLTDHSGIIEAYNYFVREVDIEKYNIQFIKECVQFACIRLEHEDDEQQIFDTMNSVGLNLTTSELLKNYFFMQNDFDQYEKIWLGTFERDSAVKAYWNTEVKSGNQKLALIDIFFHAYLQILSHEAQVTANSRFYYSRTSKIASAYRDFINHYCAGNKDIVLNHLSEYAEMFRKNIDPAFCKNAVPRDATIERVNIIILGLGFTTLIPYILFVAMNVEDRDSVNDICRVLESYYMRRVIAHRSVSDDLPQSLLWNDLLDAKSLAERLQTAKDASDTPNDESLLNLFQSKWQYNTRAKAVLYLIESSIHPKSSAVKLRGFNEYTLEHLMPKNWRKNWVPPILNEDEAKNRDAIILTMGNLGIIPQSLNSSIRDAKWELKKAGKGEKNGLVTCASGLITMQNVVDKDEWNESQIQRRAKWLWKNATKIWPYPLST